MPLIILLLWNFPVTNVVLARNILWNFTNDKAVDLLAVLIEFLSFCLSIQETDNWAAVNAGFDIFFPGHSHPYLKGKKTKACFLSAF